MPLKYWDEAFLSATYLINRLPTEVLDFCACWPNLRPFNTHKLQFHSKQCVFLGYNTLHKGFKCLDVAEGRVYVSRDVVFDETIYPFHKLNPNVGARLRGEIQLLPSLFSSNPIGTPSLVPWDELIADSTTNIPVIPVPSNASCHHVQVEKNLRENAAGNQEEIESEAEDGWHTRTNVDSAPNLISGGPGTSTWSEADPGRTAIANTKADAVSPGPRALESLLDQHMSASDGFLGSLVAQSLDGDFQLASESSGSGRTGSATPASRVVSPVGTRPGTRLQHGIRKANIYNDGIVRYGLYTPSDEPQNHHEALQDDKWKNAMDDEFHALQKNGSWHLVPARSGANIIDCKWVYKIIRKSDGTIDR
jgi:hypothetical protein